MSNMIPQERFTGMIIPIHFLFQTSQTDIKHNQTIGDPISNLFLNDSCNLFNVVHILLHFNLKSYLDYYFMVLE